MSRARLAVYVEFPAGRYLVEAHVHAPTRIRFVVRAYG
jgi:hypothetical protein